jgi:hypothetical protein
VSIPRRIAWDPGIGFGKTVEQNFALLARQRELLHEGYPLLAGWSRKSSLGAVTGIEAGASASCPAWRRRCWRWTAARHRARARRARDRGCPQGLARATRRPWEARQESRI